MTEDKIEIWIKLIARVEYCQKTGNFFWCKKEYSGLKNRTILDGKYLAGGIDFCGYRVITFKGLRIKCHRLAWFIVHGRIPTAIDHIDGNRQNNSIKNLRESNVVRNGRNRAEHRKGRLLGTSKVAHTSKTGRKLWVSQAWLNGKKYALGRYLTEKEAHEAYLNFRKENDYPIIDGAKTSVATKKTDV
jgi:hypothetical protein